MDVRDAVDDFNRSGGSAEDKAFIVKRAQQIPGGTKMLPEDWISDLQESVRLQELGIPTFDGEPQRATPLRESSAAALADRGVPIVSDDVPASAPGSGAGTLEAHGIPMLAPSAPTGQRVRLTESVTGAVLRRVA
jgi:hypothetical protein